MQRIVRLTLQERSSPQVVRAAQRLKWGTMKSSSATNPQAGAESVSIMRNPPMTELKTISRPTTMRLALGHVDEFDRRTGLFAQQLGLTSIQFHCPSNLGTNGPWSVESLRELREGSEAFGLYVEGIENLPPDQMDQIMTGGPGRDRQIDDYCHTIRNLAAAGIDTLGYHFMVTYVWRTEVRSKGRGEALATAFDLADVGHGNALASYKLTSKADLAAPLTREELWLNHAYFLNAVLPVAESAGVRLALHPDDPPVSGMLGGTERLFNSVDAFTRAYEAFGSSRAWGLDLCLGTTSEMADPDSVEKAIEFFGPKGKIFYVHMRDVSGHVPKFEECFLGEGNYEPAAVIRQLRNVGFSGFIIDDHVPAMVGDPDTWQETSSATYCSRGRAYQLGLLQGLMMASAGH
jgi:mannonate dehydratase